YFFEKGIGERPSRLIYDRAHSAFASMQSNGINWESALQNCAWFHTTGITLALSKTVADETRDACGIIKRNNGIVSFDINYRTTLWETVDCARNAISEFLHNVDVLIGNKDHIQTLLLPSTIKPQEEMARHLFARYPKLRVILITHRFSTTASDAEIGAFAATKDEVTQFHGKKLHCIVDRIGSGDAIAAGFIFSLIKNAPLEDAVKFALAAGTLAHMTDGDNFIVTESDIISVVEARSWQLTR
ncbi:MAG: PfkB family carbohydrate kinase, partial [Spirochaetes bacterium]|nr:PfkB family carbohydrate kinase [Spirochaetota bacterium]